LIESFSVSTGAYLKDKQPLYFQDSQAMNEFFANPEYLKVKQQYFQQSVGSSTIISSYEKNS
jgi:hypothetical protein